jgi:hypothetical protein
VTFQVAFKLRGEVPITAKANDIRLIISKCHSSDVLAVFVENISYLLLSPAVPGVFPLCKIGLIGPKDAIFETLTAIGVESFVQVGILISDVSAVY